MSENLDSKGRRAALAPRVNLNGDRPEELLRQLWGVYEAAEELERAIGAAWPHGRNYQTLGADAYWEQTADTARMRQLMEGATQAKDVAYASIDRLLDSLPEAQRRKLGRWS